MSFSRLITLDLLKTIAIGLMVYDHLLKYLAEYSTVLSSSSLLFFVQFTPLASFLFLSISGYTLSSSWHKRKSGWVKRKIKHALILIGLSILLLPTKNIDNHTIGSYFSSGILQTIGVFQLISMLLLGFNQKKIARIILYIVLILVTMIFSQILLSKPVLIPFFTSESFPIIPFAPWFFTGMLTYEVSNLIKKLPTFGILAVFAAVIISYLGISPFNQLLVVEGYWQPTWILSSWLMFLFIFSIPLLTVIDEAITKNGFILSLSLPGKYSLIIYFTHLYLFWIFSYLFEINKVIFLWSTYTVSLVLIQISSCWVFKIKR